MSELKEVRCRGCGRLLGIFSGQAKVKCPKTECGGMNIFDTDTGQYDFIPKRIPVPMKERKTSSGITYQ